jgi:hypothetical protein
VVGLTAPDISAAAEEAARHANTTGALIATATNAAFGDLHPVVVFERRIQDGRREYFQSHVESETGLPRRARPVRRDLVLAFLGGITTSPEKERLVRAATHYNLALRAWRPGGDILAVTPLWMAAETLTDVFRRSELARTGLDEPGLAASWGMSTDRPDREWRSELSAEVRRRLIFEGDGLIYGKAKKASDGWEHGFLSFEAVRGLAAASRVPTARYVRSAILRSTELDEQVLGDFTAEPYSAPAEYFPYARYLKGWLVGDADDPARDGETYPVMDWKYSLRRFELATDDGYSVTFEDQITPHLADGVSFQGSAIEVWGPRPARNKGVPPATATGPQ